MVNSSRSVAFSATLAVFVLLGAAAPAIAAPIGPRTPISGLITDNGPQWVTTADGLSAWESNTASDTVQKFDLRSGQPLTPRISVDANPAGLVVAPNGALYVAVNDGVSVVTPDGAVTHRSGPEGVRVAVLGSDVFVSSDQTGLVAVYDWTNIQTPVSTFAVCASPVGLTAAQGNLWVACQDKLVELPDGHEPGNDFVLGAAHRYFDVAISPDGAFAYVAGDNNAITKYNITDQAISESISVPDARNLVLTQDGTSLYVTQDPPPGGDMAANIVQIDTATNSVVNSFGEYHRLVGIAITPDQSRVIVAAYSDNLVESYKIGTAASRVSGADRYETSVAIAQAGYPQGASTAFIASGSSFPDALSAGPAAVKLGAPLLLTAPTSLPASVKAELQRLGTTKVNIVGGLAAVSASVQSELQSMNIQVNRISGADRFATSRLIAQFAFPSGASQAMVATGLNFPDALSGAAAIGKGSSSGPIVLVNGAANSLDSETAAVIGGLHSTSLYVAGGTNAVSSGIEANMKEISPTSRFAGTDRYQTSALINSFFFSAALTTPVGYGQPKQVVTFATGSNFPDALAGSSYAPIAAPGGAPLYTVQPGCVPQAVLAQLQATTTNVTLFGGENSLNKSVEALSGCQN